MSSFSPIVIFAYNRPIHFKQILDALANNNEAKQSDLYIYIDGPKDNDIDDNLEKIKEVNAIAHLEDRFKSVKVYSRLRNLGLSKSIIGGVTEILRLHAKIIVLEDDIMVSKGFLKYMNDALLLYQNEKKVGCIHAWNYQLDMSKQTESTFFLKGADCWGWATWKESWDLFNNNGAELLKYIESNNIQFNFNRRGTHDFVNMLKNQIQGKNDSWAIRWHASLFINDIYCLHPTESVVTNIGLDDSGVHCGVMNIKQGAINNINLKKIEIKESDWFYEEFIKITDDKIIDNKSGQVLKKYLKRLFRL